MKNQNLKVYRYLDNLTEDALKQALKFILCTSNPQEMVDNVGFIYQQVEDMAIMYPELNKDD